MATQMTRPDAEQVVFSSPLTGDHILDEYLQEAEVGGRKLGSLLGDIFDPETGNVRAGLTQFRLNAVTREFETRAGFFVDPEAGWTGSGAYFSRFRGAYTSGQQYRSSDYVVISGVTYIVTADHLSGVSPDMAKFADLLASATLSAIGAVSGVGADKLAYFTGSNSAQVTDFPAFGRSLVAAASAAAARSTLGLSAAATMSLTAVPSIVMAGTLRLAGDPVLGSEAVSRDYLDQRLASSAQTPLGYTPVNRAGDTLTGFLSLHANPTSPMHAANKQYVDATLNAQVDGKVNKAGDTMTGNLTVNATIQGSAVRVGSNSVWHAGNLVPSNYLPRDGSAKMSGPIYARGSNVEANIHVEGDIGGSFNTWATNRWPALQVDAPDNSRAYMIARVTKWGSHHLAGIDVYSGGATIDPTLRFHVGTVQSALIVGQDGVYVGSNKVWHEGTLDLGALAPKASPSFTGTPTAPTPGSSDNSTRLATTAYVVGKGYLPASSYTAADVLSKLLTVDGPASGLNADLLDGNHASVFATKAEIATLASESYAAGTWNFGSSGWQVLPSGLILQWATYTSTVDGAQTFNFPRSFASGCYSLQVTRIGNDIGVHLGIASQSTTQFVVNREDSIEGNQPFMILAVGV